MKQQVFPAAKELKSVREVQKFFSHDDVTILAFFDADTDYLSLDNYKEAGEGLQQMCQMIVKPDVNVYS